jgi:hypothetical protein
LQTLPLPQLLPKLPLQTLPLQTLPLLLPLPLQLQMLLQSRWTTAMTMQLILSPSGSRSQVAAVSAAPA